MKYKDHNILLFFFLFFKFYHKSQFFPLMYKIMFSMISITIFFQSILFFSPQKVYAKFDIQHRN
jgi:hypothetical protein